MTVLAAAVASTVAAGVLALVLARQWFAVITVAGASMEPTLRAGDRVLVQRHGFGPLRVGAIVVFRVPDNGNGPESPARGFAGQPWGIKRVAALPGGTVPDSVRPAVGGAEVVPPGMLVLLGDGARSGDSRQWGFVPADRALGPVVRTLTRAGTPAPANDQQS